MAIVDEDYVSLENDDYLDDEYEYLDDEDTYPHGLTYED